MKHSRLLAVALVLSLVSFIPVPANACGAACNQAPVASFDLYQSSFAQWSFDASSSYDPDGPIVSYHWYFSDGESYTSTSPYLSRYLAPDYYYVTLTVTDEWGACDSATQYFQTCGGAGQGECPY